jgi:actin-related protein
MADNLHNAPIVLDNGSGTIRAGFAGDDLPKCYFPSFVGRPKHLRVLAGALEGDVFIGQRAQELRGLLKIRYPLEHGIVTDWDDMERIWEWVYGEGLKTLSEEVSISPARVRGIELGGSLNLNPGDQETRLLTESAAPCLINRTASQPSK